MFSGDRVTNCILWYHGFSSQGLACSVPQKVIFGEKWEDYTGKIEDKKHLNSWQILASNIYLVLSLNLALFSQVYEIGVIVILTRQTGKQAKQQFITGSLSTENSLWTTMRYCFWDMQLWRRRMVISPRLSMPVWELDFVLSRGNCYIHGGGIIQLA